MAVASVLAACSPAPAAELPAASSAPWPSAADTTPAQAGPAPSAPNGSPPRQNEQRTPESGSRRPAGGTAGSTAKPRAATTHTAAVSCMADRSGDGDGAGAGSAPGYADIIEACVREAGSSLRFEVELAGAAPGRAPDRDTSLSIGFDVRSTSGATSYLFAEADATGWTAYLTHGEGRRSLPGAVEVRGGSVRLLLPASEVDGSEVLAWKAESSWSRSTLFSTSYAFDTAPDQGPISFDPR